MYTIFLTGATGNLGSRILTEFLKHSDTRFILLTLGNDDTDARAKVEKALLFWETPADWSRIEVIRGDITSATLGLSKETYERIRGNITHVIHCAANFKLNLSLEEARTSIVEGTKHLVELVEKSKQAGTFKKFNYISSLDAAGDLQGSIVEEFFTDQKRHFLNTYQQAKAEAEECLREEYEKRGLPITIYRPSMLVGDSESGKIINPQSLYHLINEMFLHPESKILPGKDFLVDPMPLDVIAKGMYAMYDAPETTGKVYHYTSGTGLSLTLPELVNELQKIYQQLTGKTIPKPKFIAPHMLYFFISLAYFFSFGASREKFKQQRVMMQYLFLKVTFDNTEMKKFLADRGITIPPLGSYLPRLCEYMYTSNTELAPLQKSR